MNNNDYNDDNMLLINKNFEKFLKNLCNIHQNRITYFCTNEKCVDQNQFLLCIECFNEHSKDHQIHPSYDLFSYNLLGDINKVIQLDEEELYKAYKSRLLTLEQIDEIYKQLHLELVIYLDEILKQSKIHVFNLISFDKYQGYASKMYKDLHDNIIKMFCKEYDEISKEDIISFSKYYIIIANDLKKHKIDYVENIRQQITQTNQILNDLFIHSNRLRASFEDFEHRMLTKDKHQIKEVKPIKEKETKASNPISTVSISHTQDNSSLPEETQLIEENSNSNTKQLETQVYNLQQLKDSLIAGDTKLCIHSWDSGNDYVANDIALALSMANKLTSLDINFGYKSITFKGAKSLCTSLETCKSLDTLKLWFGGDKCKLNNDSAKAISKAISYLSNLKRLDLLLGGGFNQILDEGFIDLAKSLENLPELTHLEINLGGGNNKVTDEGIKILAESLSNLTKLTTLKLSFWNDVQGAYFFTNISGQNSISNEGIIALALAFTKLIDLKEILLNFEGGSNKITDQCIQPLSQALENMPHLESVWINMKKGLNKLTNLAKNMLMTACQKAKEVTIFV